MWQEGVDEVLVFTDGSMIGGWVGAGWWRRNSVGVQYSARIPLGREMEVYDSELVGIEAGVRSALLMAVQEGKRKILVLSDNQAAVQRMGRRGASSGEAVVQQVWALVARAERRGITVTIGWVKGHCGVEGNEQADRLAKAGAQMARGGRHAYTSIAYLRRRAREHCEQLWSKHYQLAVVGKGKRYGGTPSKRWAVVFNRKERGARALLSRLRTGHIDCGHYLHRIGKITSPACFCGSSSQTVRHVLLNCRLLSAQRKRAKDRLGMGALTMAKLLWSQRGKDASLSLWRAFQEVRKNYGCYPRGA